MARNGIKHTRDGGAQFPLFNDRPIYGGDTVLSAAQGTVPAYAARPERKPAPRKMNMMSVLFAVFVCVTGCLFYTSTVISVISLGREMNELTIRYNIVASTNEVLRADINRKSNLERITQLAQDKAGLINPREAPAWFEIDHARVEELVTRVR